MYDLFVEQPAILETNSRKRISMGNGRYTHATMPVQKTGYSEAVIEHD
jgi:hypothetical protein